MADDATGQAPTAGGNGSAGPQAGGPNDAPLFINGQYIKDLSLEVPNAPRIFQALNRQPQIQISIDVQAKPLAEKVFEVTLHVTAKSTVEEQTAFLVELTYGAVATLNVPQEQVQPLLLVEVPRHLFPFARAIVADITRDAGFPPVMVAPVDFVTLYRQRVAQAQQQTEVAPTGG